MAINDQVLDTLTSKAWILPFENNIYSAVSDYEIVHVLAGRQRYTQIPQCPSWCRHVFMWCNQLIVLFDMNTYINNRKSRSINTTFSSSDIICIVSYENREKEIQYGGFLLSSLPFTRPVIDEQMCEFPQNTIDWGKFSVSCFKDSEIGIIPILDIPRIFCNSINNLQ